MKSQRKYHTLINSLFEYGTIFILILLAIGSIFLIQPEYPEYRYVAVALKILVNILSFTLAGYIGIKIYLKKTKKETLRTIYGIWAIICFILGLVAVISTIPVFSRDFYVWIVDNQHPSLAVAYQVACISLTTFLMMMSTLATFCYYRSPRIDFRKAGAILILCLIGSSATGAVNFFIHNIPKDFDGCVGSSEPIYSLPSGAHWNTNLDLLDTTNESLLKTLEQGLWAFQSLRQPCGGFPIYTEIDFCTFVGDGGKLYPNEISLQDGTPLVGKVYLEMYKLEPNPTYLTIAENAADAVIGAQDPDTGGFYKYMRFDEENVPIYPNHRNPRRHSSYDDNTAQGCVDYLIDIYNVTENPKYRQAAQFGLQEMINSQYDWGGWPQETNYYYPDYQVWSTLNDGLMDDMIRVFMKAIEQFPENSAIYRAVIDKSFTWLSDIQGNGGSSLQLAWAQQYDFDNNPAWARRFEPPAMCGSVTANLIELFIDLYCTFNDSKYLSPIPEANSWLNNSKVSYDDDGSPEVGWARLYELGTNIPIFGIADGKDQQPGEQYVYSIEEARTGYSWYGTYGEAPMKHWDKLIELNYNITSYLAWRRNPKSIQSLHEDAIEAQQAINNEGFWIDSSERIHCKDFKYNVMDLLEFLHQIE